MGNYSAFLGKHLYFYCLQPAPFFLLTMLLPIVYKRMGTLKKLCSQFCTLTAHISSVILPQAIRLIILTIIVSWSSYKRASTKYKYLSMINKQSSKFVYRRKQLRLRSDSESLNCSICLSDFMEGEEGRELRQCKHTFHRNCIEKWLQGYQATCPLCRHLVLPKEIVAEHQRLQNEQADNSSEEELALLILSALHGRCHHGFF